MSDDEMSKLVDELLDSMTGVVLDEGLIEQYKAHAALVTNVATALLELHAADDGMLPNPFRDRVTEDMLIYGEAADSGVEIGRRLKVGMTAKEANQTVKEATHFIHEMYVDMVKEALDVANKNAACE
jgi:alpha/beta superfamily hydrolase